MIKRCGRFRSLRHIACRRPEEGSVIRHQFEPARDSRYFEDYHPGAVYEFPVATITEAGIVAFACEFDPQPYHADPVAARDFPFGGVIASGWHTGSLMMRCLVDHYLSTIATLPSPGVDEMRWMRPVRVGDALRLRVHIVAARRSASKPDRGIVDSFVEMLNQNDLVVMTLKPVGMFLCRNATEQPPLPQPGEQSATGAKRTWPSPARRGSSHK